MLSVLLITFPFFALVLCGYLAARRGVLPQPAIPGLNAFVLYFALPCMLFRFGMNTPVLDLLNPFVLAVYVLCALVVQAGQAGPWILASGLMRYAFVTAASVWPWLNGPLTPSKRRQTVCVVQITTLIVCLGPIVPPLLANALAAISLALLTLSFAIDVRTLARQRPTPPET